MILRVIIVWVIDLGFLTVMKGQAKFMLILFKGLVLDKVYNRRCH